MGGRGAFLNSSGGNFHFVEKGKVYHSIGLVDGVKVLLQDKGASKAPEMSHSANRIYAIVQNQALKHIAYYDENHNQIACIDFLHSHRGIKPHQHFNLNHCDDGIPATKEQFSLAAKIRREFHLK